jgi:hypothetical protein
MRSGSVLLAFNRSCPLYSVPRGYGERAGITPPAHSSPNLLFSFRGFSRTWQTILASLSCSRESHSAGFTVLCSAAPDSFISYLTSSSRTRMAKRCRLISSPSKRCLLDAAVSRNDLSHVAGEFVIFGAYFSRTVVPNVGVTSRTILG